jgi:hypothetical protein
VGSVNGVAAAWGLSDSRPAAFGRFSGDRAAGGIPLINRSGAASVAGHIYVYDTANDKSAKTTTTPGASGVIGVCIQGGQADGTDVLIAEYGVAEVLCNGTVNRGDYIETSATAGEGRGVAAPTGPETWVGRALTARSGAGSSVVLVKLGRN